MGERGEVRKKSLQFILVVSIILILSLSIVSASFIGKLLERLGLGKSPSATGFAAGDGTSSCFDSDGKDNFATSGYVDVTGQSRYSDSCVNFGNTAKDWYCCDPDIVGSGCASSPPTSTFFLPFTGRAIDTQVAASTLKDCATTTSPFCLGGACVACVAGSRCGPSTDVGECAYGSSVCSNGAFVDCVGDVYPVTEVCNDLKDNDCDGLIDCFDSSCTSNPLCGQCTPGETQLCTVTGKLGVCSQGQKTCLADGSSYGACTQITQPTTEVCNDVQGLDEDCDGYANALDTNSCGSCGGQTCTTGQVCYNSACCTPQLASTTCGSKICGTAPNNCGQTIACGSCNSTATCTTGQCIQNVPPCTDGDGDKYALQPSSTTCTPVPGQLGKGDCDDTNNTKYPNAVEKCNNVDDDCDGVYDDNANTWCASQNNNDASWLCQNGACVDTTCTTCTASQVCYNNACCNPNCVYSDVCDEAGTASCGVPCARNTDGASCTGGKCGNGICVPDVCTSLCGSKTCGNATDSCGVSRTCGTLNGGCGSGYTCPANQICESTCVDADGDLFAKYDATLCPLGKDCNDGNIAIKPGATELCDNIDQDCDANGAVANNVSEQICGPTGVSFTNVSICKQGTLSCSVSGVLGQCAGAVYPTNETCDDRIDNDCDFSVDEGCGCTNGQTKSCDPNKLCKEGKQTCTNLTWGTCQVVGNITGCNVDTACAVGHLDVCGSNVGECQVGSKICLSSGEWAVCDDVGPAEEICDGLDNNCDGIVDEGCGSSVESPDDGGSGEPQEDIGSTDIDGGTTTDGGSEEQSEENLGFWDSVLKFLERVFNVARLLLTPLGEVTDSITVFNEPSKCADADGGISYFVKGSGKGMTQDDREVWFQDFCYENDMNNQLETCAGDNCYLAEKYCEGNKVKTEINVVCDFGCTAGACIPTADDSEACQQYFDRELWEWVSPCG